MGSKHFRRAALWLVVALAAAGCTPRPGAEALDPAARPVAGAKTVTVLVAEPDPAWIAGRSDVSLTYRSFTVSIPPGHQAGTIEWSVDQAGEPDPARSFATIAREDLDEGTFLRTAASIPDRAIFVHGYNYSRQEALFRVAQMAADSGRGGTPILYAWPSAASATAYVADKDAATASRDGLATLLTELQRRPGRKTTLIGHSMGAWLSMEALRQLRLAGRDDVVDRYDVVLAAPDIDVAVFETQARTAGRLQRPLVVLVSPDDLALGLSSRLGDGSPRLGALEVSSDEAKRLARRWDLQIIDISALEATDGFNHDRYVALAAAYAKSSRREDDSGARLGRAGAFVLKTVGTTLSSPFTLAGKALGGE